MPDPDIRERLRLDSDRPFPDATSFSDSRGPLATADQIKALIRSHAEGDDQRFFSIALQVAAHEARTGKGRFARELRDLIDQAQTAPEPPRRPSKPVPLVQPQGELAGLLTADYPDTRLADMVLDPAIRERLERVIAEHRQRDRLAAFGLHPRHKLLLLGPPGSGKTMTAHALAGEMRLPMFTVRLDGLITRYLGETAAKLRLVFDAIERNRAVYLFDEFDALGTDRGADNDVGEIRRVLNSFLQFLEQESSDSIIVGATNHAKLLDRALFRRFDDVIEYGLPSPAAAEGVLRARLAVLDTTGVDWSAVVGRSAGLSYAELTRASLEAAKSVILADRERVTTSDLIAALEERRIANA